MDKGKKPVQEIALNSSNFSSSFLDLINPIDYQDLLIKSTSNRTIIGSSSSQHFHPHILSRENQPSKNSSIACYSNLKDLQMNDLISENPKDGFRYFGHIYNIINIGDDSHMENSHLHTLNDLSSSTRVSSLSAGSFPNSHPHALISQQIQNQSLSPQNLHTISPQSLSPNNSTSMSIGSSSSSSSTPDSRLGVLNHHQNLPSNSNIIHSSSRDFHKSRDNTPSQSHSIDSRNLPSNDSCNENGFAEWGSASGISFLNGFDEEINDDLLNVFNNINHINPPDHVFPMEVTPESASSAAPTDHPPAAHLPAAQPNLMALSPRARQVLPTEMLKELTRSDPRRARRIITNRKAALKANDKKKKYVLELEGRIHILLARSDAYKSELTMLEKSRDVLQNKQDIMGKRLKCVAREVHLQEKLNQKASEDVKNLREVLGLKPTDDVMEIATRMIPALNQQTQPSANHSSAQQRDTHRPKQQFQYYWLQDHQAPPNDQHKSSHYQYSQRLVQSSTTTQHHLPFQPSSSSPQLQLHSSHQTIYHNTRRNNQSSSSTTRTSYAQEEHRYQLQQHFARQQPLPHLLNQPGQNASSAVSPATTINQMMDVNAQYEQGLYSNSSNNNMHPQQQN